MSASLHVGLIVNPLAGLGGHLKRNGAPGWLTLSRGYQKLSDARHLLRSLRSTEIAPLLSALEM